MLAANLCPEVMRHLPDDFLANGLKVIAWLGLTKRGAVLLDSRTPLRAVRVTRGYGVVRFIDRVTGPSGRCRPHDGSARLGLCLACFRDRMFFK